MAPKGHLAPRLPESGAQRAKLGEPRAVRSQQRHISWVGLERVDAPLGANGKGRPDRMPAKIRTGVHHHGTGAEGCA